MKYCALFTWGALTAASWFLAWNKLGREDMPIPNGFLAAAVISTLAALVVMGIVAFIEWEDSL